MLQNIPGNELLALAQSGQPVICLDVREGYRQATLYAGGVQLPYNQIAANADRLGAYRDHTVVLCCLQGGGRSNRVKIAGASLRALGFRDVRQIEGGLWYGWITAQPPRTPLPGVQNTEFWTLDVGN